MPLLLLIKVQVRNLTSAQNLIVTKIESSSVCHNQSCSPLPLENKNTLRETAESNKVSSSTRHIAKVLYEDFTTKRYGDGTHIFNDNVVIGANKRYISLHKTILVTTSLDPRMNELSPFLNDNHREAKFEYMLELMDDDLDKVSGIDSSVES